MEFMNTLTASGLTVVSAPDCTVNTRVPEFFDRFPVPVALGCRSRQYDRQINRLFHRRLLSRNSGRDHIPGALPVTQMLVFFFPLVFTRSNIALEFSFDTRTQPWDAGRPR